MSGVQILTDTILLKYVVTNSYFTFALHESYTWGGGGLKYKQTVNHFTYFILLHN
jgi:hypothetical protein